jgi:hypothetical protein
MIFNNYLKGYLSSINLWYGVSEEKYSDLLFSDPAISLASTTHKYLQQWYVDGRVGRIGCLYQLGCIRHACKWGIFSGTFRSPPLPLWYDVYTPQNTNDATINKTYLFWLLLSMHLLMNMIFLWSLLAIFIQVCKICTMLQFSLSKASGRSS